MVIWILSAFFTGGFLGFVIAAMFASTQIAELKLWNRRLQEERDEARKDLRLSYKDAENYRELLKEKQ